MGAELIKAAEILEKKAEEALIACAELDDTREKQRVVDGAAMWMVVAQALRGEQA